MSWLLLCGEGLTKVRRWGAGRACLQEAWLLLVHTAYLPGGAALAAQGGCVA